jgi:hypothetical protein
VVAHPDVAKALHKMKTVEDRSVVSMFVNL